MKKNETTDYSCWAFTWNITLPLGTIKASQVVVLTEDMQLLLNENSYKQRDPN